LYQSELFYELKEQNYHQIFKRPLKSLDFFAPASDANGNTSSVLSTLDHFLSQTGTWANI